MKNFFFFFAVMALAATGCSSVDKELVDKMTAGLSTLEGIGPGFESLNTKMSNLNNQLSTVPESVKGSPEYQNLLRMSETMNQKNQATLAEYNDLTGKFKTLVADYSAGKIKTEDAKKELETLITSTQGFSDVLDRMNQHADSMQAEYAKMSANINAKAEETAK